MSKRIVTLLAVISVFGCQSIHSISMTEIAPGNTKLISAEESSFDILHMSAPDMKIQPKLREQCPEGIINGVQTTLMVREFILFQIYDLKASAYCK